MILTCCPRRLYAGRGYISTCACFSNTFLYLHMQLSSKKDLHSIRHNPKNSPDSYRTFEAPGNMDCDQSNLSEISARLPVIVTRVFSYLDGEQLAKAREVCKTWNKLATDEGLWKPLCVKN